MKFASISIFYLSLDPRLPLHRLVNCFLIQYLEPVQLRDLVLTGGYNVNDSFEHVDLGGSTAGDWHILLYS